MFRGTIHLPDDAEHLNATMVVDSGRVIIQVEGQPICDWEADEITLEHRPDGILLSLHGESLVVSPVDRYGFSDAVEAARDHVPKKRRRRRRGRKTAGPDNASGAVHEDGPGAPSRAGKKRRRRRLSATTAEPAAVQPAPVSAQEVITPGAKAAPKDPWIAAEPSTRPRSHEAPMPPEPEPPAVPADDPLPRPLSDAAPATTDDLPGRQAKQEQPVDINREIFGEDYDRPEPKRPGPLTRLRAGWADLAPRWRAVIGIATVGIPATIFASETVATVLVLGGLGACLLGGAGMADPHYTRKLPPQVTEIRLLIAGMIMIIAGFLVGLPSL